MKGINFNTLDTLPNATDINSDARILVNLFKKKAKLVINQKFNR